MDEFSHVEDSLNGSSFSAKSELYHILVDMRLIFQQQEYST